MDEDKKYVSHIKEIKFPDWLRSKGLDPKTENRNNSKYLPEYYKEVGFCEEAIKGLLDYGKEKEIKDKESAKKWKAAEDYVIPVILGAILALDSFANFLPKSWAVIMFIVVVYYIIIISIKKTVRKEVEESKKD